jgi:hypothetical protein
MLSGENLISMVTKKKKIRAMVPQLKLWAVLLVANNSVRFIIK